MGVIFSMSLRNLREHKSKTIIIGLFIAVGLAVVELGNGFLESVNRGMEKDFRAHYTGDVMVSAPVPEGCMMDLFGISSMNLTEVQQIPAIADINAVDGIISETENVTAETKMISAKALMMNGEYADFQMEDQSMMSIPTFYLFAGEPDTYFKMFPGQKITEGRLPAPGTNEILVDERLKTKFSEFYKEELFLERDVILVGANMNMVVRSAKVTGFYRQPDENSCMYPIVYCDPSLARSFADLTYGSAMPNEIPEGIDTSVSELSEDDLFGGDEDIFSGDLSITTSEDNDFDGILGDTTLRDQLNRTDDGAWHFILLRTAKPSDAKKTVEFLNGRFKDEGILARACDWHEASGTFTSSVEGISVLFTAMVIILAVVVFIIIMNTMTISVIERTGEIGTMRALGAEKNYVRKLFFCESVTITLVSAAAGSVLSLLLMLILNLCGITVSNDIAKMILGGGSIKFIPTAGNYLGTTLIILTGSILANIYPVSAALKITPLKALSKGDE